MSCPRRHLLLAIAAAMALGCVFAPAATAKPRGSHTRHFVDSELRIRGSHHFEITVLTVGDQVSLLAEGRTGSVSYLLRGHVTRRRMVANLGRLGRISVRFKASKKETETLPAAKGCKPPRSLKESGVFKGTISFHGERGFTTVHSARARGDIATLTLPPCAERQPRPGPAPGPLSLRAAHKPRKVAASLTAVSQSKARRTVFSAARFPDSSEWFDDANVTERRGRIAIERNVFEFGAPDTATLTKRGVHPASTQVNAPKPFLGSATYSEEPVPPALPWDGSLRVELPGIGMIPLAGKGFHPTLCNEKNLDQLLECEFEEP
jgi:hypothetical protein